MVEGFQRTPTSSSRLKIASIKKRAKPEVVDLIQSISPKVGSLAYWFSVVANFCYFVVNMEKISSNPKLQELEGARSTSYILTNLHSFQEKKNGFVKRR